MCFDFVELLSRTISLFAQPTRKTATLIKNIVLVMEIVTVIKSQLNADQLLARVFRLIRAHEARERSSQYKYLYSIAHHRFYYNELDEIGWIFEV